MSQAKTEVQALDTPAQRAWTDEQDVALRLWVILGRCHATYAKAIAAKVQDYGLTTPQFGTLEALYHLGPLSLGELAEKLLVTGGNVTYVMDRLEDQGLVYRYRRPDDRRVILARLTPEGRDLVAEVFPGHASYVEHLSRHLSSDEQEQLAGLLKTLGSAIHEKDL
ncbi:MAG: MarR family transcriptional regulator [Longimicrobiales bacterium]|jgi:MarR family 2-MHQ and catechol resistance regulon transcriptional repressor|nr:MarR family transcriptional regulator [Longimicrobiales bacterium]